MKRSILIRVTPTLVSIALLLSSMLPLFVPAPSAHAQAATHLTATIAFYDSQGNIWIIDKDDANAQQIMNTGRDCCATWPPDGNRLHFLRFPRNGLSGPSGRWRYSAGRQGDRH